MKRLSVAALAIGLVACGASGAQAAVINMALAGSVSGFTAGHTDFSGLHFDQFSVWLTSPDFPVMVSEGDTVNTTVTFDGAVTIPASKVRTDLVQYLGGSTFPSVDTQVDGIYNFYSGLTLVDTFGFSSTTSGGLATFSAVFPPKNNAFTFDSFTDNFVVTKLSTPATLERSSFTYSLVSKLTSVPEPQTWAMMFVGFGLAGAALRRRPANRVAGPA